MSQNSQLSVYFVIQMKLNKIKKQINSSFVTNHDLIEEIRNKSFLGTRQNSSRLHTNPSKVSLIKKKSYERLSTLQQNNPLIGNTKIQNFTPTVADKAIMLLQDCMKTLGETNQKLFHKLKIILTYLREMQTTSIKEFQQNKRESNRRQQSLKIKCQQIRQENTLLKHQNQCLRLKIDEYKEKIENMSKENLTKQQFASKNKNSSNLQQIIINQSEVINKQCEENERQNLELRHMLKAQALSIEDMIRSCAQKDKLKNYLSLNMATSNIR